MSNRHPTSDELALFERQRTALIDLVRSLGEPHTRQVVDALGCATAVERNRVRSRMVALVQQGRLRSWFVHEGGGRVVRWSVVEREARTA